MFRWLDVSLTGSAAALAGSAAALAGSAAVVLLPVGVSGAPLADSAGSVLGIAVGAFELEDGSCDGSEVGLPLSAALAAAALAFLAARSTRAAAVVLVNTPAG